MATGGGSGRTCPAPRAHERDARGAWRSCRASCHRSDFGGAFALPRQPKRAMTIHEDVLAAIGNTPLIRLRRASEETGCTILGKAEFMNPGQSVKDRAAREMILGAERRGEVRARGGLLAAAGGEEGGGPRARPP